jgi:hypothetical protein
MKINKRLSKKSQCHLLPGGRNADYELLGVDIAQVNTYQSKNN